MQLKFIHVLPLVELLLEVATVKPPLGKGMCFSSKGQNSDEADEHVSGVLLFLIT